MLFRVNLTINITKRRLSYGGLKSWYSGLVKRPPPIPPYNHVVQIGDPTLRAQSELIPKEEIKSDEIKFLIQRLQGVMKQYNCVGMSAAQIGIALRIFLIEFNEKHAKKVSKEEFKNKEMEILQQTVIINPKLKVVDYDKVIHTEACASVKGFWADVARYRAVELQGFNENGDEVNLNLKGWLARIAQHEFDHLDGKMYTDIMDRNTFCCTCWQTINDRRGKVEIPFSC